MKTIYKYELFPGLPVEMPADAEVLSVGFQDDNLYVWALVSPVKTKKFHFKVYGTGWEVPANPGKFIGTAHHRTQRLVFHVFLDTTTRLHSA